MSELQESRYLLLCGKQNKMICCGDVIVKLARASDHHITTAGQVGYCMQTDTETFSGCYDNLPKLSSQWYLQPGKIYDLELYRVQ